MTRKRKQGKMRTVLGYAPQMAVAARADSLAGQLYVQKVNFYDMMDIIRHGVDYWWILCAMGISVCSHIFRALRWRIQLRESRHRRTASGSVLLYFRLLCLEPCLSAPRGGVEMHIHSGA